MFAELAMELAADYARHVFARAARKEAENKATTYPLT